MMTSGEQFSEKFEKIRDMTIFKCHYFFSEADRSDLFFLTYVKTRVESFRIGFKVRGDQGDS